MSKQMNRREEANAYNDYKKTKVVKAWNFPFKEAFERMKKRMESKKNS